jgi:hypothetical protein
MHVALVRLRKLSHECAACSSVPLLPETQTRLQAVFATLLQKTWRAGWGAARQKKDFSF